MRLTYFCVLIAQASSIKCFAFLLKKPPPRARRWRVRLERRTMRFWGFRGRLFPHPSARRASRWLATAPRSARWHRAHGARCGDDALARRTLSCLARHHHLRQRVFVLPQAVPPHTAHACCSAGDAPCTRASHLHGKQEEDCMRKLVRRGEEVGKRWPQCGDKKERAQWRRGVGNARSAPSEQLT